MAECAGFTCTECGFSVSAWSDGNPFYLTRKGAKVYAYHPNHDKLAKCIANDVPHLCMECGKEIKIDSRLDTKICPKCCSGKVIDIFCLEKEKCPKCKSGHFLKDRILGIS